MEHHRSITAARKALGVLGLCALALTTLLVLPGAASAVELEPIDDYSGPVYVTSDPNDADRLFVIERTGQIRLTQNGHTTLFMNIGNLLVNGGESGLLSMAFASNYAQTGRFYVVYTGNAETAGGDDGDLHLDEFVADGGTADPSTRRQVLTIDHSTYGNHNGGQLQTGPDGLLYWSTGDGGGSGDDLEQAQDRTSLLGKILRINPRPSGSRPYTVPASNPFVGIPGRDEIWSYGLRNPWRFSFDMQTGALLVGDVGQDLWEEVDYDPVSSGAGRGDNFGWDCREAMHDFELTGCSGQTFVEPILEYAHAGGNCSITGGYVVRDPGLDELTGRYVYADFCAGQIRSLVPSTSGASGDRSEDLALSQISTFGEDACGRVYVASLNTGTVYRLVDDTPTDCPHVSPPPSGSCVKLVKGTSRPEVLRGGLEGDRMIALAGGDTVVARGGEDCLNGGSGADTLKGGPMADRLRGAEGPDEIVGGLGDDVVAAERDGEDEIFCGAGDDVAHVSANDVTHGCERVPRAG